MWSENERQILTELKKTCVIHMFLQSGSAYHNYMIHNFITLPNITIGAILSVSILSTSSHGWRISSGVMAIVSTILSSIARQLGAGEKAQLHATVAKQYQAIIRQINMNLLLEKLSDEERIRFIETITTDIDKVFSIQPEAANQVVKEFETKYNRHLEMVLYPEFNQIEGAALKNVQWMSTRMTNHVTNRITDKSVQQENRMETKDARDVLLQRNVKTYYNINHHRNSIEMPNEDKRSSSDPDIDKQKVRLNKSTDRHRQIDPLQSSLYSITKDTGINHEKTINNNVAIDVNNDDTVDHPKVKPSVVSNNLISRAVSKIMEMTFTKKN